MKTSYKLDGITCGGCVANVTKLLNAHPQIQHTEVSLTNKTAVIETESKLPLKELQALLANEKYSIYATAETSTNTEAERTFLEIYKPLFILAGLLAATSFVGAFNEGTIVYKTWMRLFMAGFFLAFSYFKLINVKGFANSFKMYDIVAGKFSFYGYLYPFIELALGFAYLLNLAPLATNLTALIIMSVGTIGVANSVLNKRKIQCACLGSVFNLPMSTVTIIENSVMIVMAGYMVLSLV